jgi:hypothetical protein
MFIKCHTILFVSYVDNIQEVIIKEMGLRNWEFVRQFQK